MLMGLVIKYADNILKSFAASVTVVFTYVLSYIIFGTPLNAVVVFGSYIVILSVFFYSVKVEECYKNGKI
jgi:UDP-sugar transporter A1/2/3